MASNRIVQRASLALLALATASLLYVTFVESLPFAFIFTMQLAVIVVAGYSMWRWRRIPGLTADDNFWPALRLLPKRPRYLLGTAIALGFTPFIIGIVTSTDGDYCHKKWWELDVPCSVSWREEDGVYTRQVNRLPPQQVSKPEYEVVAGATDAVFAGVWIAFLSIAVGMNIVGHQMRSGTDANDALDQARGQQLR